MANDPKLERLRRVQLFSGLDAKALGRIASLADDVRVDAGKRLTRQGDRGEEFFLVVDGEVEIERDGRHVARLGPGSYLGEIALIDDAPRTATATTVTPAQLMVIGHREFHTLMDDYPELALMILRSLTRRIRELQPGTD
jgi:CRP-like cAMP-binding protein